MGARSETQDGSTTDPSSTDVLAGDVLARPLAALTVVVVVGGIGVRLWALGRQSYWTDEIFSVGQAASGLSHAWDVGLTEVHPPLYAVLLTGWEALGGAHGTAPSWTRLLSALFGVLTVLVAWASLRSTPLSATARAVAVASVASCGLAIVYAQETRSYSLLLLAATGLTAATVAWTLSPRPARMRALPWLPWLGWALLASATHLFGLVLAVACAATLAAVRRRWTELGLILLLLLLASVPQLVWVAVGRSRPGFAEGTAWIEAPGPVDVRDLLSSVFASGQLRADTDGFPWVSVGGLIVVVALILAAGRASVVGRRTDDSEPAEVGAGAAGSPEGRASVVLLLLAGVLVVGVYAVSQDVHLWTTRNMIVAVPALAWGVPFLVLHLAGRFRDWFAGAVLLALAASLVLVASGLQPEYKTDFRGTIAYLTAQRFERPDLTFVVSSATVPYAWFLATDPPVSLPGTADAVFSKAVLVRRTGFLDRVAPVPGPAVYVFYADVAALDSEAQTAQLIARVGGPDVCRSVPIHGMVVVRCDP